MLPALAAPLATPEKQLSPSKASAASPLPTPPRPMPRASSNTESTTTASGRLHHVADRKYSQGVGDGGGGQRSASAGFTDADAAADARDCALNVLLSSADRASLPTATTVARGGNGKKVPESVTRTAYGREHSATPAASGSSPAKPLRNSAFAPLRPIEFGDAIGEQRRKDESRSRRSPQSAPVALSLAPGESAATARSAPPLFPRRKVSDPPSTVRRGLDFKGTGDVILEERAGEYRPLGSQTQPAFRSLPSTFAASGGLEKAGATTPNTVLVRFASRDVDLHGHHFERPLECDPLRRSNCSPRPTDELLLNEAPRSSRERELTTIQERRGEISNASTVGEDERSSTKAALEDECLAPKSEKRTQTSPPTQERHKCSIIKEELDRALQQLLDQIATLSIGEQVEKGAPPARSESSECFVRQPLPPRATDIGLVASAEDVTTASSAGASSKASCSEGAWSAGRSAEQLVLTSTPDNGVSPARAPPRASGLSPLPAILTGENSVHNARVQRAALQPVAPRTHSHSEANYTRSSNSTESVLTNATPADVSSCERLTPVTTTTSRVSATENDRRCTRTETDRAKSPCKFLVEVPVSSTGRREKLRSAETVASNEASALVERATPRRMSDSFILDQTSASEGEEEVDEGDDGEEKTASGGVDEAIERQDASECTTVVRRTDAGPLSARSTATDKRAGAGHKIEEERVPTPASLVSIGSQTTNSLVRRGRNRVLLPGASANERAALTRQKAALAVPQVVTTQNAAVSTESLTATEATDGRTEDATADEEAGASSEGEVFKGSSVSSSEGALGAARPALPKRASERRSQLVQSLKPPAATSSRQTSHERLESATIPINQLPLNNIVLLRKVCYAQLRQVLEYFCPREDWRAARTSKQQSNLLGLFDAFLRRPRVNATGDAGESTILDQLMRNPHVELLASPSSKAAAKARAKALKHLTAGAGGGSELTSSCSACPVHQLFGVSLERLQLRFGQPLPPCVAEAMRYLRDACADPTRSDTVGIFRRAGNRKNVRALRRAMELCAQTHTCPLGAPPRQPPRPQPQPVRAEQIDYTNWESCNADVRHECRNMWPETTSVYDVADCVKQFFRELPECLFTRPLSQLAVSLYLSMRFATPNLMPPRSLLECSPIFQVSSSDTITDTLSDLTGESLFNHPN